MNALFPDIAKAEPVPPAGATVALVSNGDHVLAIPADELRRVDQIAAERRECERCGGEFYPRTGSGGQRQRFCSAECRKASHADGKPNVPTSPTFTPRNDHWRDGGAVEDDDHTHDWSTENEDVLLRGQPATKIHRNGFGQIVILQEGDAGSDTDVAVYIAPENLWRVIARLKEIATGVDDGALAR